jgi:hypothetical protein
MASRVEFERQKLVDAVRRGGRAALLKFGAFVRQTAKRLIRPAPKVDLLTGLRLGRGRRRKGQQVRDAIAPPGSPPYAHLGAIGRAIFFAVQAEGEPNVVIGPVLSRHAEGLGPLEKGGQGTIYNPGGRSRSGFFRAHPFMRPALEAELDKAPEQFRDCVRE